MLGSCLEQDRIGEREVCKRWKRHLVEYRHLVDKACCRRGGVAGAEPPHKGGPNRPDRPKLQWLVVSGQWSEAVRVWWRPSRE